MSHAAVTPSWSISIDPQFTSRNELASYCNKLGLVGHAVEIGVHKGEFSKAFCNTWNGYRYIGLDNYSHMDVIYPGYEGDREDHYVEALAVYDEICIKREIQASLCKISHQEFLQTNDVVPLSFVLIDHNHSFLATLDALERWLYRVHSGAVIACHDYDPRFPDVVRAVNHFASSRGIHVKVIADLFSTWSCFFHRP